MRIYILDEWNIGLESQNKSNIRKTPFPFGSIAGVSPAIFTLKLISEAFKRRFSAYLS